MDKETLRQKIWYRCIKVFFILAFILSVSVSFIIKEKTLSTQIQMTLCDSGGEPIRPNAVPYWNSDNINCASNPNDSKKVLSQNKRTELEIAVGKMEYQNLLQKDIYSFVNNFKEKNGFTPGSYTDKQILGNLTPFPGFTGFENYSVYWADKYSTSYQLGSYLQSFLLISLFFWVLNRCFFYIVTGKFW